ncbi:BrnT family toxin [Natronospira bacteriovora]|uniref:BrnT family toxin n=1 Tax=Natronospira bacteriovora TaxID=3069753 RepID=A0ABU0W8N4_9GAMM|nr:BrnT family toxin [Natronospira sp. AB-CW4]MDQ2070108.1 BrnT family toxin [Natronospira sp. AB-CW4]
MKTLVWSSEKNQKLIKERGVSFEDVLFALQSGRLLDDLIHPKQEQYPGQRLMIVEIDDYAWLVPYVESESELFLKTIIPSRKATRKYLAKRSP